MLLVNYSLHDDVAAVLRLLAAMDGGNHVNMCEEVDECWRCQPRLQLFIISGIPTYTPTKVTGEVSITMSYNNVECDPSLPSRSPNQTIFHFPI